VDDPINPVAFPDSPKEFPTAGRARGSARRELIITVPGPA